MRVLIQARQEIIDMLANARVSVPASDLVFPPDAKMGDLSLPLFAAAKEHGVAPGKLAQELVRKLKPMGLVERAEAVGAYLNFFLSRQAVADALITPPAPPLTLRGGKNKVLPLRVRGSERGLRTRKIMLEMISPNNNKPLHLGHLRNAFLGESVACLLESQGAKVIRACLYNDRGLHIAKAMLGYQLWGKGKTPESERMKPDQFVVQWYVLFERKAKEEQQTVGGGLVPRRGGGQAPTLQDEAEELVRKWEAGDKATLALWKKMAGWALEGINATLKRLGMKFDTVYFESKLWKPGKKVVAEGLKRGVFKKDENGAVIVEFYPTTDRTKMSDRTFSSGLPSKVLLRSDGTAIYATSDLALTPEKFKKYQLDRAIWCVGQEQALYLQQLFTIFKMLGYRWAKDCPSQIKDSPCRCEHLSYGLVHLPEGRMKTREGTVVEADQLLDALQKLVAKEVKARHDHLSPDEIEERAEKIAQAAVRYYLLKVGPKQTVHFDPQSSIAFIGDTGPYLLYTYARIASILRKGGNPSSPAWPAGRPPLKIRGGTGGVMTDLEWHIIMILARFPEIISQSATDRDPSHLAKYLFELCQKFSEFYEKVPVLQSAEPDRSFRLALIKKIQSTLKAGLRLLTIDTVEEM